MSYLTIFDHSSKQQMFINQQTSSLQINNINCQAQVQVHVMSWSRPHPKASESDECMNVDLQNAKPLLNSVYTEIKLNRIVIVDSIQLL